MLRYEMLSGLHKERNLQHKALAMQTFCHWVVFGGSFSLLPLFLFLCFPLCGTLILQGLCSNAHSC